jgi:hypothetical protein
MSENEIKKTGCGVPLLIFVGLIVLAVVVNAITDGGRTRHNVASYGVPTTAPTLDVVYEVTASKGGANLTYNNQGGNTEQRKVHTLPFKQTYTVAPGHFLYLSAQTTSRDARITCRILVNGKVAEEATSQGDFVIATCSGSARRP